MDKYEVLRQFFLNWSTVHHYLEPEPGFGVGSKARAEAGSRLDRLPNTDIINKCCRLIHKDLAVLWKKLADFGQFSDLNALSGLKANFRSEQKV